MSFSIDVYKVWQPATDALNKVDATIRDWADLRSNEDCASHVDAVFGGWGGFDLRERLAMALLEAQGYAVWDIIEDTESPPPGWSVGDVLAHVRERLLENAAILHDPGRVFGQCADQVSLRLDVRFQ